MKAERWWPLILVLALCGAAWVLWGFAYVPWYTAKLRPAMERAGQFGDLFGGINALFTAFAFAAVWWTGLLQREDLRAQRDELIETRNVFKRQNFEATYFAILRLIRDVQQTFELSDKTAQQRQRVIANECRTIMMRATLFSRDRSLVGREYEEEIYEKWEAQLGPYFRTLYQLFKLIDTQEDLSDDARATYANLARAQLSSDDLVVLALNCISDLGGDFTPLVEKYGLLKHLPQEEWFSWLQGQLAPTAFLGTQERAAHFANSRVS